MSQESPYDGWVPVAFHNRSPCAGRDSLLSDRLEAGPPFLVFWIQSPTKAAPPFAVFEGWATTPLAAAYSAEILSFNMKRSLLIVAFASSLPLYCQQTARPATVAPLQYVLLNDVSGRTLWPQGIEQQVAAATQFLKQVVISGTDRGTLVNFSEEFPIDVENSTNPDELVASLVHRGYHGTALFDAVIAAADWLEKQESSGQRKTIFVFSDGDDDASRMSVQSAVDAVQKAHASLFVIAPSVVERKKEGKAMKQLANATGGHAYFLRAKDSVDFTPLKHDLSR